ncbi:RluA family pseudouridine synthase [Leptospira ilyithenensis]|uniref:RluA family pseudouridine synthase n=1 Tax=Leptospira ilyithenensis TaxID=2484901 RepID=UPI00143847A1|nr:RluA family pseudouridine synthase [Leptospira ilyithenensis]
MSSDPLKNYKSFVPSNFHSYPLIEYLKARFPYHNEEDWISLVENQNVLINGNSSSPDLILKTGDEISYSPKPDSIREPAINRDYHVLAEKENFLVVNKPPNIPVHPAGRYRTNTLLNLLEHDRKTKFYPVHRLDRETSGIILFAKTAEFRLVLQKLFEERLIRKEYLTFVYGRFPETLVSEGYMGKDPNSSIRKKQSLRKESLGEDKLTFTEFSLLSYDPKKNISVLLVKPHTGRIHQIRATLLGEGFPVVGDKLYGKRETAFLDFIQMGESDLLNEELGHNRQCLHAYSLSFVDPTTGETNNFHCPLSFDLCRLIANIPSEYVT